jgi:hypothetical protein
MMPDQIEIEIRHLATKESYRTKQEGGVNGTGD